MYNVLQKIKRVASAILIAIADFVYPSNIYQKNREL